MRLLNKTPKYGDKMPTFCGYKPVFKVKILAGKKLLNCWHFIMKMNRFRNEI